METYNQFIEKYSYEMYGGPKSFSTDGDIDEQLILTKFDNISNSYLPFSGILSDGFSTPTGVVYTRFSFYRNGVRHRLNGPATLVYNSTESDKLDSFLWVINGFEFFDSKYQEILEWYKQNNIDINNMTPEDEILAEMKFGNYNETFQI